MDDIKKAGKKQNMSHVEEIEEKTLILMSPQHSLITYVCDVLNVNAPNGIIIEEHTKMFESCLSAGATEKLPGWEKPHAKTVAWSYWVLLSGRFSVRPGPFHFTAPTWSKP